MALRGFRGAWLGLLCIGYCASIAAAAQPAITADADKLYRAAFAAAERGDWQQARTAAMSAGGGLPASVLDWLDYQREDGAAPFADIAAFIDANEPWPRLHALRRNAERRLDATIDDATLLAWFARHPSLTGQGAYVHATALRRAGRDEEAVLLAREAWIERDFQDFGIEDAFYDAFKGDLDGADHAARIDRLLWADSITAARRMLKRVGHDQRALAEARIALMEQTPGVDGAINRVPAGLRGHPGLWFERMRWHRRKGRDSAAIEILQTPHAGTGRLDRWFDERELLARRALGRGRGRDAYRAISGHGMWRNADFARGEYLAGWISLTQLGDAQQGYAHFGSLYAGVRLPLSLSRAAYWSGRAAIEVGDTAAAKDWFETAARHATTYYGQLALHQLDRSIPESLPAPQPSEAQRAAFNDDELVRVVRILKTLDQDAFAPPFLFELGRRAQSAAERALAAILAAEVGRHKQAIYIAKVALQDGQTLDAFSYPLPDIEIGGVSDPALVMALIRQESSFEADATSPAGALGLMQLMPSTARLMSREVGTPYRAVALTGDPAYNVQLGVTYLTQMLDRYDGSYPLALSAYNAGPGRTDGWIKTYGDPRRGAIDPVDWIEMIPFAETRNYVQRVIEAVPYYRRLLGLDPQFAWLGRGAR